MTADGGSSKSTKLNTYPREDQDLVWEVLRRFGGRTAGNSTQIASTDRRTFAAQADQSAEKLSGAEIWEVGGRVRGTSGKAGSDTGAASSMPPFPLLSAYPGPLT